MEGFEASTYGERIAEIYDATTEPRFDADATADVLAELAGDGRALELAIGTGRIALRLVGRGVPVEGIDISPAMVAQLRAKPGGDTIPVAVGDFADVAVEGKFRLIYLVFNTFFALLSQDDQLRCFANVAAHLAHDGRFVVEGFVPAPLLYDQGQRVSAVEVGVDRVRLDAARLDIATQRVEATHVVITEAGIKLYPVALRYAWPAELDLMARLAGLHLEQRWSGWDRAPFGSDSAGHVSVYGRTDRPSGVEEPGRS